MLNYEQGAVEESLGQRRNSADRIFVRHETVRHSAEQWVVGDVNTNSVEGVWSLFKRSIIGSFHKVSRKHLDRYLEELEWRFNNRDNPYIFRDALREIVFIGVKPEAESGL